ncbi:MAG: hypothetical protein ACK4NE_02140 [Albidovulum sp.]
MVLVFGTAADLLIAVAGNGMRGNSAGPVLTVFLATPFVVALVGDAVVPFRRTSPGRRTGSAEARIDGLAAPTERVAYSAIARDRAGATDAARQLIQQAPDRGGRLVPDAPAGRRCPLRDTDARRGLRRSRRPPQRLSGVLLTEARLDGAPLHRMDVSDAEISARGCAARFWSHPRCRARH